VSRSALAIEFFHTASLIADDLPCMDNDDERRSKPALHKVYGESIALLASYALICAGFRKIYENAEVMREGKIPYNERADLVCTLALESATSCAGILGATGGQFLDLFPPPLNLETLREIIYKKTVTLFEGSFVLGWLFGGGEIGGLDRVKKTAYHLGMAFQIADDIGDTTQDENNKREINSVKVLGKERAVSLFHHEMELFRHSLSSIGLLTPSFEKMGELLIKQVQNNS
jgi:geranylgeranyl diphosphate synthase type II